jgi:hypothetical protein
MSGKEIQQVLRHRHILVSGNPTDLAFDRKGLSQLGGLKTKRQIQGEILTSKIIPTTALYIFKYASESSAEPRKTRQYAPGGNHGRYVARGRKWEPANTKSFGRSNGWAP